MKKIINNTAIFSKLFWLVVGIKIFFSFFFASSYMTKGFIPFVSYFIQTGKNPYDHFYLLHQSIFPYPAFMLLVFSIPMYIAKFIFPIIQSNIFLQLFLMRLPILFADVSIYIVLCLFLPTKEKRVLLFYFASPIIFYINYFHGQLDSIPTALLFISLLLLLRGKYILSYILLGLGIATKTHLILILPFYFIYTYKMKIALVKTMLFSFLAGVFFFAPNVWFLSTGFINSVFNNPEQQRLLFLQLPFEYKGIALYIAPLALLGIWYRFASYKKINIDSLLLMLGLAFTVLIALVPPMQGWFYWSLPFLVYFFIKYERANSISFWMMNVFYLLFFLLRQGGDLFESSSVLFPQLGHIQLSSLGIFKNFSLVRLQNIMFTGLEGSVIMNALWCYRIGVHYNNIYMEKEKPFILGISGNSGVGKSTLTNALVALVGESNSVVLNGDDAHKWERGDEQWKVFTHLNPKSNKIHVDYEDVYALRSGKIVERSLYSHKTGKFSSPQKISPHGVILLQGLHAFFLKDMQEIFDTKIFIETSPKVYKKWKIERDMKDRGYNKNQIAKEIKRRESDFKKFIAPQKKYADWIIRYDMSDKGVLQTSYSVKNTIPLEELLNLLQGDANLSVHHEYKNAEFQQIIISGIISAVKVKQIAYTLFPNMQAFLHTQPIFYKNTTGVSQLIFLSILNKYFLHKKQKDEEIY